MTESSRSEIVRTKPIGDGLNAFRASFKSTCQDLGISVSASALSECDSEAFQNLALDLVSALQALPSSRVLRSIRGGKSLLGDIVMLMSWIYSGDFEVERLFPLLTTIIDAESDEIIWDKVYTAIIEHTPPPRPLPFLGQTPILHNTSSFVNSSEHRKYVDDVLKDELGTLFIGIPGFQEVFFGKIKDFEEAGTAIFRRCTIGQDPLYSEEQGWRGWPENATQNEVLRWLTKQVNLLVTFAEEEGFPILTNRRTWARPDQPLQGSTADRKLDIAFISKLDDNSPETHWSHILIPGELKSNPSADTLSKTWLDLGRYVREVFAAQDNRRFVLAFTLCGSVMRLWEFDRSGGIASTPFDINEDGHLFVSVLLGYLWMDETQLGFDPTIRSLHGVRFIEIFREGKTERLIIDGLMKRAPCIAGRATTCWKAHREGDETKIPLVIKDSWQYPERGEEGLHLREAVEKEVVNVARYYHHETVQVDNKDDEIQGNIRNDLDVTKATNFRHSGFAGGARTSDTRRKSIASSAGRKRSSSGIDASSPPSKRTCSSSFTKSERSSTIKTRIHRRVILRDYGKPIYKAKSRVAMISALESCVEGYESLHLKADMLQGDISTGNLMMNEEEDNPSWPAFLIDLDLAIQSKRSTPSGAWGKTGTRAFMAIGLLLGEEHSFMHDLESFFWVLFWICIHYSGPDKNSIIVPEFDKWNYADMQELAKLKKGVIDHEGDFLKLIDEHFTTYHKPFIPWVNRLRRLIFPNGSRWEKEHLMIYSEMKDLFRAAKNDPKVIDPAVT